MKIYVSNYAGFCFGIARAVQAAYEMVNNYNKENNFGYGQIAHNPDVIGELTAKGMKFITSYEDIEHLRPANVLIRAHGVPSTVIEKLTKEGKNVIDKTCPKVKKVHNLVGKHYQADYQIIIIGNKNHPEIIGTNGWCNNTAIIIGDAAEAKTVELPAKKLCIVVQTTYKQEAFDEIVDILKNKHPEALVFNTICNTTQERQEEVKEMAKSMDCMLVLGGKHSANTTELADISSRLCSKTIHLENVSKISLNDLALLDNCNSVGIVTGASTPCDSVTDLIAYLKGKLNIESVEKFKN